MKFSRVFIPAIALTLFGACDIGGVTNPSTSTPPPAGENPMDGVERVTRGLQALYTFEEGAGTTIRDISGVGTVANLTIAENPAAVMWLPGGGIDITAPTRLMSTGPIAKIGNACSTSNAITLEAWVQPAAVNQTGPALIMSYSNNVNQTNFSLGQEDQLAEIRVRTSATEDSAQPGTQSDLAVFNGGEVHVVYTRTGLDDKASVYLDGQYAGGTDLAGTMDGWGTDYMLAVGNDVSDDRSWRGKIHLAAVYCTNLSEIEVFQNYSAGH